MTGKGTLLLLYPILTGRPVCGKGKRGGLRVIYLHTPEAATVDLFTVYGKDEKDDLSADELKAYVYGNDPVTGRPVMQEIVAGLTTMLNG